MPASSGQGSSVPVMVNFGNGVFFVFFWFLLGALCTR